MASNDGNETQRAGTTIRGVHIPVEPVYVFFGGSALFIFVLSMLLRLLGVL